MDPQLCADGLQVTFTAHKGFGGSGHLRDKWDGSPGYSDRADVATLHDLCIYGKELVRCGAFLEPLVIEAGRNIHVRPPAAHFLPMDD